MAETKKLIPKRRFKEFQNAEAWEERKLCEFSSYYTSSLTVGDAKVNGKYRLYDVNAMIGYTNEAAQLNDYITIIKDGSGVGRVRLLPKKTNFIGTMGAILSNNSDINFLYCCLENTDFSKHINGATIPHVYYRDYGNDKYFVPSIVEQKKIGTFFKNLDNLITLHRRKLDKIKSMKKAYLSEMFPAEGESRPKRRFKGFSDDWEVCKLGKLTNILSAARVHKEEWTSSGVPFFRSSDVVSNYKGKGNDKAFISLELYTKLIGVSGKLEKDDILITGGGSIGIPYIVPNNAPLYSKDADLIWVKSSVIHDSRYLFNYFATPEFRKYLSSISHTGTIAHYTIEQVKETPICLPSIDEQNVIGLFFTNLDNLITLHQQKLDKLKNLKKAYLNEMFI